MDTAWRVKIRKSGMVIPLGNEASAMDTLPGAPSPNSRAKGADVHA